MALSRLRLRLAAWFGVAFLVGLAGLDFGLYAYLRGRSDVRLTAALLDAARGLVQAIRREATQPGMTLPQAADSALAEWPQGPETFVVSGDGAPFATRGARDLVRLAAALGGRAALDTAGARVVRMRDPGPPPSPLVVVAAASTAPVREYAAALAGWLAASIPVVTLFALLAGYLLAQRALRPVAELEGAIARIAPEDLDRRLPVRAPPDELDRLAEQCNRLLERLAAAQARNRTFVARAAHQLKTPLTVVHGESSLGLERERSDPEYRDALRRIQRAAEQMGRRVDDLLLLARAEAGERPPVSDVVELDGLVLECADLMRGRAETLGRTVELDRVEPAKVIAHDGLLREGLLELLENALRHGSADRPVRISAYVAAGRACLAVASGGPAFQPSGDGSEAGRTALGISILQWIADVHRGSLRLDRGDGVNVVLLEWPAA